MRFFSYLLFILVVLSSCKQEKYYRTKTGLLYKVVTTSNKDSLIHLGQIAKIEYIQKVGDSVMSTTEGKMPLYYMVLPGMNPYNPLEALDYGLRKGDSVVTIQRVDSMMRKKIFEKKPSWMKPSDEWITTMKVVDVFTSDSLLQLDKQKEMDKVFKHQMSEGMKRIEAFLKSWNIDALKDSTGFLRMIHKGEGMSAESGKWVSIQFNLKTTRGKILNSTIDTSFHQPGPIGFVIGTGFLPPVIESKFHFLSKGSYANIYVPAVEVFGVAPQTKEVKPDDDIIFEVSVVDVKDKAPEPNKNTISKK